MLAIVGCIAYDTSANVSPLEGAHGHLTFRAIILYAAIGAFSGFILGVLGWAAEIRKQTAQRMRDEG